MAAREPAGRLSRAAGGRMQRGDLMSSLWGRVVYAQSHMRPWSARISQVAAAWGCQFDFQSWKSVLLPCRLASAVGSQHSVALHSSHCQVCVSSWNGEEEWSSPPSFRLHFQGLGGLKNRGVEWQDDLRKMWQHRAPAAARRSKHQSAGFALIGDRSVTGSWRWLAAGSLSQAERLR